MSDQQDIRRLGGLIKFLPFIYSVMLICSMSLIAMPWLTGFFSKDLIIELSFSQYSFNSIFSYILISLTAFLTAFYSFRLISLVFLSYPNSNKLSYTEVHESNLTVLIPLFILSIFSIFFGYIFSDLYVGLGSDFLSSSIFQHPNNIILVDTEFGLPLIIKLLPSFLTILGLILGIYLYNYKYNIINEFIDSKIGRNFYIFLNNKYYFDILYNYFLVNKLLISGYTISKVIDKGAIEQLGPNGLVLSSGFTAYSLNKLDTGIITTYALYMTLGIISILFYIFSPIFLMFTIINLNLISFKFIIIYILTIFMIIF